MALSDACFEFLESVGMAAQQLAGEVHRYSAPDTPLQYGDELDALRRACAAFVDAPYDAEAGARLLRLAASVMQYHDLPPVPELAERRRQIMEAVRLLQKGLPSEDAEAVPALMDHIVGDTPFTEAAVQRLKPMLSHVGKVVYEAVIKIIADVGSATAKRMLGL